MRAVLFLAFAVLVLAGTSFASADSARTVVVTGSGTASAAPDEARFSVSIRAEAPLADQAMDRASTQARAVLAALTKAGVAEKDIQTSGVSLQPIHARGTRQNGEPPRVVAHRASLSNSVRVRDIARLGGVLDAAIAAGGDGVSGVGFFVSDRRALEDRARADAVTDAARAAGVLAKAAGGSLGPVLSITENEGGGGGPRPMMAMRAEGGGGVPIAAGEITVAVRVRVVYQLSAK